MKRFLLLVMTLALAVLGIKAEPVNWSYVGDDGKTYTGKYDITNDKVKIEVEQPGGLAVFLQKGSSVLNGVSPTKLEIGKPGGGCELNADDFTALNSSNVTALKNFKTVDLKEAIIPSISTMSGMNLSGMEYLRLPSSFDNAPAMKDLRSASNNTKLKMVMSTENEVISEGPPRKELKKVRMYSFVKNNVVAASTALDVHLNEMKCVDMAGYYGEYDLYNGNSANFGEGENAPAAWDFTGANFAECTISGTVQTGSYYNYDDPFEEGEKSSVGSNYQTNSFFYFNKNNNYTDRTASIKLPDLDMAQLPARCLYNLGSKNKENYLLIHPDLTAAEISELFPDNSNKTYAPIEQLVIPNCYTLLDTECALEAHIKSLLIGNGDGEEIIVQGGAFRQCIELEDLDFVGGISECWLGDMAFNECNSMKHIALAEGIVSIGSGCFYNSQHLESIRLPETLVYMGNACFDNCLALSSMTIPSNVEKIGKKAFKLCPISDFYLTTTDPNKIPYVYSLGTNFNSFDENCTFYNSHLWGWNTINGVDEESDKQFLATMTWEQAVTWYFSLVSGMAVLHFPEELAEKVRASISDTYSAESSDGFKLPMDEDKYKRDNIDGADLGSSGNGKFTQDGWAQFLLMKGYQPGEEDIVYTKEYSDVWYTMCFPFDLTDEQLAAAFNETFNIVDFSGIELKAKTDTDPMKMILHFNKVAVTYYKDVNEKVYHRLCEGGTSLNDIYWGEEDQTLWREQHGNFKYNVYIDNEGNIYHHVHPKGGKLDTNKTKTFAISSAAGQGNADNAIIIDGILAEAGHPYMIHPAIGVNPGQPKKACNMAGITWRPEASRAQLYENRKRTIDLGVESTREKNRDNYYQAGYTNLGGKDYTGQEYTFIGNSKDYKDGWQDDTSLPTRPTDESLVEPKAPQNPNPKPKAPKKKLSAPDQVPNPDDDAKYTDVKDLFKTVRLTFTGWTGSANVENVPYTYGEDLANYGFDEFFENDNGGYKYRTQSHWESFPHPSGQIDQTGLTVFKNYMGDPIPNDVTTRFAALKSLAEDYQSELDAFNDYDVLYEQYLENKALWDAYDAAMTEWNNWTPPADVQQEYTTAYNAYLEAKGQYDTWKTSMGEKGYNIVIPEYAYFLGTKTGEIYPKYFRERSKDQYRSTGLWTQYTAIVIPNDEAIAGVEKDLDAKTQVASGSKIAFNEPFFFIDDTPQGITTLIEKIEKEEGKAPEVEYMDIVVSIDGKIVSRDKTTFEGLPKGVYIINGKKYYVK